MGRIQDAIARLEVTGQEKGPPLIEASQSGQNGHSNWNGKVNGHLTPPESSPTEQFDFIGYSLNPAATVRVEVRGESVPLAEAPHRVRHEPVREVQLDNRRMDPHLVLLSEYDPAAAEQYQRVAFSLIAAAADRPLKRVLIASALQGDGRTCVLLNLAGALAQAHRRVLVVDTDLRYPSVSRLLGLDVEMGLTEVLANQSRANDVLCKVLPGGFDLLPTQGQPENSAELLASPDFGRLLDSFDHEYDFILFDSAPLLVADDALLLLRLVDTALMVVAQGKCSAAQAARAVARIARKDIFGVVLNRLAT